MTVSGTKICQADWTSTYFGGCEARSRFLISRPGEGYEPFEACPSHLADAIAWLVDGDEVPVTVVVHFDTEQSTSSTQEGES